MIDEVERSCSICRQPATSATFLVGHPNADDDGGLYDIECGECGFYRIGTNQLLTMALQTDAHRAGLRHLIRTANDHGSRYCINDARELPLTQQQRSSLGFRPGQMTIESMGSDDDAPESGSFFGR